MRWPRLCLHLLGISLLLGLCHTASSDQQSALAPGSQLHFIDDLGSAHIPARRIAVWLPPGYGDAGQRYPVIYMHDGQNLFDPGTAYIGEEWGMDESIAELSASGDIPAAIVVGVWNTSDRFHEYLPAAVAANLSAQQEDDTDPRLRSTADAYLRYLVTEIKPYIDQHYHTLPQSEHTLVMGSSMGGLISLYALTEYPHVFGGAAALSTHWPLNDLEHHPAPPAIDQQVMHAFEVYLRQSLPAAGKHHLYFDHGGQGLDALYPAYQQRIDDLLTVHGWRQGQDWLSRHFPEAGHNEIAWRQRLDIPLRFLLASESGAPIAPNPRRPIEDEILYFVLPDRFADGDAGNNTAGIDGGPDQHGYDPTHKGYYHGGDMRGLIERLDYIQGLGATAIWFAPIFKNKPVQGDPPYRSAGYHGYWITDFTRIDPHFGSNAEFREFVDAAHARGMKVIMDIVTNHTADVIQYRECIDGDAEGEFRATDCPYRSLADYPYTTRGKRRGPAINSGFAGDGPDQQTLENFAHLTDPGYAYTPFVPAAEQDIKVPAWLNNPLYYHNRGNTHWEGESERYGDFATLDDVLTEHPRVVSGMIDIFKTWISDFRVDGFRVDTAKHVNDHFWQQFIPPIMEHARAEGISDFYIFGEVYAFDPAYLGRYTREVAFPAVLDFAFQSTVREVIVNGAPPVKLAELFAQDQQYQGDPRGARIQPTFLGNHDMGRFGHFLLEQAGDQPVDGHLLKQMELAHALMMFSRGVPVIYYGDEQGFTGHGGDQAARQDMFPSRVDSYNDNHLIGSDTTTAVDNFDSSHPLYQAIAAMARVYHAETGLRRGAQQVVLAEQQAGLFAFTRGADYLVLVNTSDSSRSASINGIAGKWLPLLGATQPLLSNTQQTLLITLPGLGYAVYRRD
ncbi:MAG: hypothetical protein Tsb002_27690 [Wenzhouxiangellaceae bacterium]